MKKLLLGDEAVALGAINAGLSGVYAYPGTPSTEITEYIQSHPLAKERGIHSRWCTNEKTAMEAALGMSYAGKRALVCMKHVGMNVCADAFVNSAITGVKGGLIVLAADDPSMHSSQNEQDSRFYAKFALVPCLEPSNQQEAYDMMAYGFELSEKLGEPIVLRVVTRLAHSRAAVEVTEPKAEKVLSPATDQWVLLPGIARKKYVKLIEKQDAMKQASAESIYNKVETAASKTGILACGIAYNYVKEALGSDANLVKISQYPLPEEKIKSLAAKCDELLVIEDGQPVVEELVKGLLGAGYPVKGRLTGDLPRTGELTPDNVAKALGKQAGAVFAPAQNMAARPPQLCQGCGHRDVYAALNQVAIIGDSTFTHSGMTGLLDAVNDKANITVVISDNLTTGMTGGQDSAGTNKYEAICLGLGVEPEHVRVVVPLPKNMPEITRVIKEEIEYKGVSVIIPRRECIQTFARHARAKKQ